MKNTFKMRIISLLLALSLLFSCMTVLSYAADGTSVVDETDESTEITSGVFSNADEGVTVQLNRTFDDGYDIFEGIDPDSVNTKAHTFEIADDGTGNKYLRMTANGTADGFFNYHFDQSGNAGETLVVKFDIIFDKSAGKYPGRILRFMDSGANKRLTTLSNNGFYSFYNQSIKSGYYNEDKHTIAYVVTSTGSSRTIYAYIDNMDNGAYVDTMTYSATDAFVSSLRLGFYGDQNDGTVFGIDNLAIYSCVSTIEEPQKANIGYGIGSASDKIPYKQDLFMKVGVDTALSHGEKVNINPPITLDGKTYVPIDAVANYLGYTTTTSGNTITLTKSGADTITLAVGSTYVGKGSSSAILSEAVASVDGEYAVVNYEDIEKIFAGYYAGYNDMGVIVISTIEHFTKMATDMQLVDVMKRFIFDSIGENKEKINVVTFDTFRANTSAHPYILADAEDFLNYRNAYNDFLNGSASADLVLGSYIDTFVREAESLYNKFAIESNGLCTAVKNPPEMPDDNIVNNGYDPDGGRQHGADEYAERMKTLAFGYQMTGNENYARLAYYYAVALGEWDHWGPAHFLNCADAAAPYAIAYDWLYNVWTTMFGSDAVANITEILFTHGVLAGWYVINDVECPWARRSNRLEVEVESTVKNPFYKMESNWNAVCSSGMTAAALAIAGDLTAIPNLTINKATLIENDNRDPEYPSGTYSHIYTYEQVSFRGNENIPLGDHTGLTTYADYAYDLFTTLQYTLPLYGLDFYAPDGSYVESPTYWAYSAKNLFAMGAYSESVFGDNFGLISNCWGLDKTCYYALNAMSSDYSMWNYSDSPAVAVPDPIPTLIFPVAAAILGQSDLAEIRRDMIDSGKYTADYLDIFYYYENESTGEVKLPELQYHMAVIDGYVARDSWEQGSTYVAIKGGYNLSAHGQVDSGEFVYHNNGKIWFCDPGAEHYTVPHHGHNLLGSLYYRTSAEGNNTLVLASDGLPNSLSEYDDLDPSLYEYCYAGQYIYGTGHMYKTGDNQYGAYALIDQTGVYNDEAISAKRGMLFTNNRSTVIIQDEVRFKETETVYWIGHTYQDIYVTTDGRTAYMTDGESVIRVSLVSSNADLRFDVLTAYEFVLKDTHTPDYALTEGTGVAELDRSGLRRLVIECKDVTELDLAVVIENVTGNEEMEVGYEFTPMDSWVPGADSRSSANVDEVIDFDDNYYGYTTSGELEVIHSEFFNNNMLTVWAIDDTVFGNYYATGDFEVGAYAMLSFPHGRFTTASLSGDYLVFDLDIYTDSHANGLSLSLYGNGSEIASQPLSALVSDLEGGWAHVTVIATDNRVYFFRDGALVSIINLASVSYKDAAIAVTVSSDLGGTVSLDNIRVRRDAYQELDALIADGNIESWNGYIEAARERAVVFKAAKSADNKNYNIDAYTFSALYNFVGNGDRVRLQTSNTHAPLYIENKIFIYYYDHDLRAYSYEHAYVDYSADQCVRFKGDDITVSWHIDADTVETQIYAGGMEYAAYPGNSSEVGKITVEVNENGTFTFYTTAWSLTEGGNPATAEDMIVRSNNCNFYLTRVEIDPDESDYPYFCLNTDGNILDKETYQGFATDIVNPAYDRIILNGDLEVNLSGRIDIRKNTKLYLNGHTLTFTGGSYAFRVYDTGSLNIYGEGGSIISSVTGSVFYVSGYNYSTSGYEHALYVENTTVEYGGRFMDHRVGPVYFKNVTFNQNTAGSNMFVVQNANNSYSGKNKPVLTLDGCTVNHYGATINVSAIVVKNNAGLIITGGTHINIPNGTAISLEQNNGYNDMSISIENAYINAARLCKCDEDGMADKIVFGDNVYLEDYQEIDLGEYRVARQNDTANPYVVTKDYASVTWEAGETTSGAEYWSAGSLPTPSDTNVTAALAALTNGAGEGKKYSFSARVVNRGENVTFTATRFNSFIIRISLTLEMSMRANIFVEKCEDVVEGEFYLDGEQLDYTIVTLDGKDFYKIVTPKITLPNVMTKYVFKVGAKNIAGAELPVSVQFSVIDYVEKVLASGQYGKEATGIMANILKYIAEAYKYDEDLDNTADHKTIEALLTKYQNKVTYSVVKKETPDNSAIRGAITNAEVILLGSPRYGFTLNPDFTGTITLGYTVLGEPHSKTFNVVDGKYEGRAYIDLELRAYDMRCDIDITTVDSEGVVGKGYYNLNIYYYAASAKDSTSTALLNAFYAYSEKAEEYKNLTK